MHAPATAETAVMVVALAARGHLNSRKMELKQPDSGLGGCRPSGVGPVLSACVAAVS